jgi:hypothetical protein
LNNRMHPPPGLVRIASGRTPSGGGEAGSQVRAGENDAANTRENVGRSEFRFGQLISS